jgi:hypothetical protein
VRRETGSDLRFLLGPAVQAISDFANGLERSWFNGPSQRNEVAGDFPQFAIAISG